MKKLIILSLLMIGITCNNGYSMDNISTSSSSDNENKQEIDKQHNNNITNGNNNAAPTAFNNYYKFGEGKTPYSNNTRMKNYFPNDISNIENDDFEIIDNNDINNNMQAQFANVQNVYANIDKEKLEDFEKWSYKKLEVLKSGNMLINNKTNENNELCMNISNQLKNVSTIDLENLLQNYKIFINKYFNNDFGTNGGLYGLSKYLWKSESDNVKSTFNKIKDTDKINKILSDNIDKFIYHHSNSNNTKQAILEKYLNKTYGELSPLGRTLKKALVFWANEHPKDLNSYDKGTKLFNKFKTCFDEVMKSNIKEDFLKAIKSMIKTEWIIDENIINYVKIHEKNENIKQNNEDINSFEIISDGAKDQAIKDDFDSKLKEFEKWSYEKLCALCNGKMYYQKGSNYDNENLLEEIRNALFQINYVINYDNEDTIKTITTKFHEFLVQYCNGVFYQGWGVSESKKQYMKNNILNKAPEHKIHEILKNNIKKFIIEQL